MKKARWLRTTLTLALLVPPGLACAKKAPPDPVAKMRGGIGTVVADKARAARMQATLDEIAAAMADADRLFAEERAAVTPMLRSYKSTREEIDRSLAEFNARHEAIARRFLAAHASLKAQATAAEWKELRELEMALVQSGAGKSAGTPVPKEEKKEN